MLHAHRTTIYTVCFMFSKDKDEVNDLYQEVSIHLWNGFDSFAQKSDIKTWIYRVSLNTCISFDRKKKRRNTVPLTMDIDLYEETDHKSRQIQALYRRINQLDPFDKAIILLWLENLPYDEIGGLESENSSKICTTKATANMEKENINHMDELKQQFALLTQRLESQPINNDKLLKTVIGNRMKWIAKYVYLKIVLFFPLTALLYYFFYQRGMISLTFLVLTLLLCVLELYFDTVINHIQGKGWLEKDLLTSRQLLVKMKQRRTQLILAEIPISIVWVLVFFFEIISYQPDNPAYAVAMGTGIGIGALAGAVIAYLVFKKMQRTNDELLREIDQLKE